MNSKDHLKIKSNVVWCPFTAKHQVTVRYGHVTQCHAPCAQVPTHTSPATHPPHGDIAPELSCLEHYFLLPETILFLTKTNNVWVLTLQTRKWLARSCTQLQFVWAVSGQIYNHICLQLITRQKPCRIYRRVTNTTIDQSIIARIPDSA